MQKHDKRTQAYRRFSFGRRASDKVSLPPLPVTQENIAEVARDIVLRMETSGDFREALMAELQRNSYCNMTFDKALAIKQ